MKGHYFYHRDGMDGHFDQVGMFDYNSINMLIDPSMKVIAHDGSVFDNVIRYHNLVMLFSTSLSHIQNLSLLLIKFVGTCILQRLIIGSVLKWILCHVNSSSFSSFHLKSHSFLFTLRLSKVLNWL